MLPSELNKLDGVLPIRVLQHNLIAELEKISEEFLSQQQYEIEYESLSPKITWIVEEGPIKDVPEIKPDHKIILYEEYLQFQWNVCFALNTIYQEMKNSVTRGNGSSLILDIKNLYISNACKAIDIALKLRKSYPKVEILDFDNLQYLDTAFKDYFEQANGLFVSSINFILVHELGHQYRKHLDYSVDKHKEEFDADFYSASFLLSQSETTALKTNKYGIMSCFIGLLLLEDRTVNEDTHPTILSRIKAILSILDLTPDDDLCVFLVWSLVIVAYKNRIKLFIPENITDNKALMQNVLDQLEIDW